MSTRWLSIAAVCASVLGCDGPRPPSADVRANATCLVLPAQNGFPRIEVSDPRLVERLKSSFDGTYHDARETFHRGVRFEWYDAADAMIAGGYMVAPDVFQVTGTPGSFHLPSTTFGHLLAEIAGKETGQTVVIAFHGGLESVGSTPRSDR